MRENLKNARKAAGMTQQQVAEKLGIGLRHYQKSAIFMSKDKLGSLSPEGKLRR